MPYGSRLRQRQKPHPFAMSVYYLAEALKKLRAVGARIDPEGFTQEMVLWCGAAVERASTTTTRH